MSCCWKEMSTRGWHFSLVMIRMLHSPSSIAGIGSSSCRRSRSQSCLPPQPQSCVVVASCTRCLLVSKHSLRPVRRPAWNSVVSAVEVMASLSPVVCLRSTSTVRRRAPTRATTLSCCCRLPGFHIYVTICVHFKVLFVLLLLLHYYYVGLTASFPGQPG